MQSFARLRIPLSVLLLAVTNAYGQMPDKFTNLQFFPKDIGKQELMGNMRRFAFALGVRCEHCHVQGAEKKMDFASDEKAEKKTARVMLQMVAAINRDYVDKLGKPTSIPVECATCHHGLPKPRTMNSLLAQTIEEKGIDAAVATYRELREQDYGTAEYDFGIRPLNQLVEQLLAANKNKEAVAIAELNFAENKPNDVWSYHLLAMAHESSGDKARALADYRRVAELHPDDEWAKQKIQALLKPD